MTSERSNSMDSLSSYGYTDMHFAHEAARVFDELGSGEDVAPLLSQNPKLLMEEELSTRFMSSDAQLKKCKFYVFDKFLVIGSSRIRNKRTGDNINVGNEATTGTSDPGDVIMFAGNTESGPSSDRKESDAESKVSFPEGMDNLGDGDSSTPAFEESDGDSAEKDLYATRYELEVMNAEEKKLEREKWRYNLKLWVDLRLVKVHIKKFDNFACMEITYSSKRRVEVSPGEYQDHTVCDTASFYLERTCKKAVNVLGFIKDASNKNLQDEMKRIEEEYIAMRAQRRNALHDFSEQDIEKLSGEQRKDGSNNSRDRSKLRENLVKHKATHTLLAGGLNNFVEHVKKTRSTEFDGEEEEEEWGNADQMNVAEFVVVFKGKDLGLSIGSHPRTGPFVAKLASHGQAIAAGVALSDGIVSINNIEVDLDTSWERCAEIIASEKDKNNLLTIKFLRKKESEEKRLKREQQQKAREESLAKKKVPVESEVAVAERLASEKAMADDKLKKQTLLRNRFRLIKAAAGDRSSIKSVDFVESRSVGGTLRGTVMKSTSMLQEMKLDQDEAFDFPEDASVQPIDPREYAKTMKISRKKKDSIPDSPRIVAPDSPGRVIPEVDNIPLTRMSRPAFPVVFKVGEKFKGKRKFAADLKVYNKAVGAVKNQRDMDEFFRNKEALKQKVKNIDVLFTTLKNEHNVPSSRLRAVVMSIQETYDAEDKYNDQLSNLRRMYKSIYALGEQVPCKKTKGGPFCEHTRPRRFCGKLSSQYRSVISKKKLNKAFGPLMQIIKVNHFIYTRIQDALNDCYEILRKEGRVEVSTVLKNFVAEWHNVNPLLKGYRQYLSVFQSELDYILAKRASHPLLAKTMNHIEKTYKADFIFLMARPMPMLTQYHMRFRGMKDYLGKYMSSDDFQLEPEEEQAELDICKGYLEKTVEEFWGVASRINLEVGQMPSHKAFPIIYSEIGIPSKGGLKNLAEPHRQFEGRYDVHYMSKKRKICENEAILYIFNDMVVVATSHMENKKKNKFLGKLKKISVGTRVSGKKSEPSNGKKISMLSDNTNRLSVKTEEESKKSGPRMSLFVTAKKTKQSDSDAKAKKKKKKAEEDGMPEGPPKEGEVFTIINRLKYRHCIGDLVDVVENEVQANGEMFTFYGFEMTYEMGKNNEKSETCIFFFQSENRRNKIRDMIKKQMENDKMMIAEAEERKKMIQNGFRPVDNPTYVSPLLGGRTFKANPPKAVKKSKSSAVNLSRSSEIRSSKEI